MIVSDYIRQKFQSFGISVSEAELLDITIGGNINANEEITAENMAKVSIGIALFIPSLMARAKSVSEGGFSMSWDTAGLAAYYSYLCSRYGIEDKLTTKSKVTFL